MWQNEPFPFIPPPGTDAQWLSWWAEFMSAAMVKHADNVDAVINGQIEFPTPGAPDHSGNLKVSYVQVMVDVRYSGQALQLRHGYGSGDTGQIPRGWFQMANGWSSNSGRFLDQILCSSSANPLGLVGGGYTSCTVATSTSIVGSGATANQWVGNGVQAGDQIKILRGDVTTGTTGGTLIGTGVITLAGAPGVTLQPGWFVRYAAGADTTWHRVESYDPVALTITVVPNYITAIAAGTQVNYSASDPSWIDITAVTLGAGGAGGGDILTLDTPGTVIPATTLNDYVIRRPMTDTYAWLRYMTTPGAEFTESTIAFY